MLNRRVLTQKKSFYGLFQERVMRSLYSQKSCFSLWIGWCLSSFWLRNLFTTPTVVICSTYLYGLLASCTALVPLFCLSSTSFYGNHWNSQWINQENSPSIWLKHACQEASGHCIKLQSLHYYWHSYRGSDSVSPYCNTYLKHWLSYCKAILTLDGL